jgi:transcriptional regulator GlxA family with amidase domain
MVDLLGSSAREPSPEERAAQLLAHGALQPFSLDELARAVALSPSRLRHRFATRFGMPPAAWHRRERLRRAHRLLASSDATVDAAARATGWSDGRALAKAFRGAFGYPPAACRRAD